MNSHSHLPWPLKRASSGKLPPHRPVHSCTHPACLEKVLASKFDISFFSINVKAL